MKSLTQRRASAALVLMLIGISVLFWRLHTLGCLPKGPNCAYREPVSWEIDRTWQKLWHQLVDRAAP